MNPIKATLIVVTIMFVVQVGLIALATLDGSSCLYIAADAEPQCLSALLMLSFVLNRLRTVQHVSS